MCRLGQLLNNYEEVRQLSKTLMRHSEHGSPISSIHSNVSESSISSIGWNTSIGSIRHWSCRCGHRCGILHWSLGILHWGGCSILHWSLGILHWSGCRILHWSCRCGHRLRIATIASDEPSIASISANHAAAKASTEGGCSEHP